MVVGPPLVPAMVEASLSQDLGNHGIDLIDVRQVVDLAHERVIALEQVHSAGAGSREGQAVERLMQPDLPRSEAQAECDCVGGE